MKKNFLVCGLAAMMALVACNQNASHTPAENTANPEESVAVAGSIV